MPLFFCVFFFVRHLQSFYNIKTSSLHRAQIAIFTMIIKKMSISHKGVIMTSEKNNREDINQFPPGKARREAHLSSSPMFHSGVSLDKTCGGLIDSDPTLKCHSRSTVLVRTVPGTDRLASLFCALWKGLIRSAIASLLTFSSEGQGRKGEKERTCGGLLDSGQFADKAVSTG